MLTILGALFVFLLVVTLHEFGHFAAAKRVGIRVNEFAVGMGPKLFGKQKGETLYTLRMLPIGGFCAMEGESEDSQDPRSFGHASVGARAFVVVAGASMNFILAIAAFFLAILLLGSPTTVIGEILPNSPAEHAGLQSGDLILKVNDKDIRGWTEVTDEIRSSDGEVNLLFDRQGKTISVKMIPKDDGQMRTIGVIAETKMNVKDAITGAFASTWQVIASLGTLVSMIVHKTFRTSYLSGPVGVIRIIGESAKFGFGNLLMILGVISANLGVVNLLPIPALDGGKLLFLLIEKLRGKPIDEEKEGWVTMAGMVFLFSLMLYITIFSDLKHLWG